jgi:hypothetical protein
MMKRLMSIALALFLLCGITLSAGASSTAFNKAVDDLAEVLHPDLVKEISDFSGLLKQTYNMPVYIITKDFLGGKDVYAFARDTLANQAASGRPEVLVLALIIGEERYAAAMAESQQDALSLDKVEGILNDTFRTPYLKDRDYNRALAAFLLELADTLEARTGRSLPPQNLLRGFAGLTPVSLPSATAKPNPGTSWLDSIFEDSQRAEETATRYEEDAQAARENKGKGISLFQIALIGFILYKIFGKKRNGRKGCGPLGWIFGTWGLSRFFGWRK